MYKWFLIPIFTKGPQLTISFEIQINDRPTYRRNYPVQNRHHEKQLQHQILPWQGCKVHGIILVGIKVKKHFGAALGAANFLSSKDTC